MAKAKVKHDAPHEPKAPAVLMNDLADAADLGLEQLGVVGAGGHGDLLVHEETA